MDKHLYYYLFIGICLTLVFYRLFKNRDFNENILYYIGVNLLLILINTIVYDYFKTLDDYNESFIGSPQLDNYSLLDGKYIDQGEIAVSDEKLSTSHLGTCSALAFSHNNKNFLAHIDAENNYKEQLISKIKNNFNLDELRKKEDIYIIPGSWCKNDCKTSKTIIDSLDELGLNYKYYPKKINWETQNSIYVDKDEITIL